MSEYAGGVVIESRSHSFRC